jgi:hypothetical protein
MNLHRALSFALLSALATSASACAKGCAGSGSSESVEASPPEGADAEVATRDAGRRDRPNRQARHGGFLGLILRAGREADLTPEQKNTVADISQKLHDEEPPLTALTAYQTDLVAGIRAGKLDTPKLQSDYADIDKGQLARQEKQADALDALHAAIEGPSRTALVAAARPRLTALFRPHPEPDAAAAEAGDPPWIKHKLNRVKAELGLDDAQQAKVAVLLAKTAVSPATTEALKETIRKHADDLLTAFEHDDFAAHKLDLSPSGGKSTPHAALERESGFIAQLLPILTPEQKEKLATMRQRRVFAHWTEENEVWSALDEATEPNGPR